MIKIDFQRWQSAAYYLAISVLVLGPLLAPGYIITFDMSWTPHLNAPSIGNSNGSAFFWLLHIISLAIPSMIIQKLLLLMLLMLAGWGAHRLAALTWPPTAAYLAGTIAIVNPFVYTRLMAGQYLVLAGYALLPWVLTALWRLLEHPDRRKMLVLAGWATALSFMSIHAIGIAALASLVVVAAWSTGRWRQLAHPVRAKYLAGAAGIWLLANAYWLAPLLGGVSTQAKEIAGFGLSQAQAFQTASLPGLPAPLAVAALEGFWADPSGQYVVPSSTGWLFGLSALALAGLIGLGVAAAWRRRDRLGLSLAAAGLIAWFLAVGLAWPPSAAVMAWMIENIPYYRGYREPQKWAALLAVAYGYAAAGGLTWLLSRIRPHLRLTLSPAVELGTRLLPLALVPMILWGAGGQLQAVNYPAGWYELDAKLRSAKVAGPTLILPWHQYLPLTFTGQLSANPAAGFFSTPVVTSLNPEMPGVPNGAADGSLAQRVEDDVLAYRTVATDLGVRLHRLGITRVVLLKQADWTEYDWLNQQIGLTLETETADWQLWRVEAGQ